eukprot:50272-Eustigmatos_ZCMA.PRE.1
MQLLHTDDIHMLRTDKPRILGRAVRWATDRSTWGLKRLPPPNIPSSTRTRVQGPTLDAVSHA